VATLYKSRQQSWKGLKKNLSYFPQNSKLILSKSAAADEEASVFTIASALLFFLLA
jgi:hypothetical protein